MASDDQMAVILNELRKALEANTAEVKALAESVEISRSENQALQLRIAALEADRNISVNNRESHIAVDQQNNADGTNQLTHPSNAENLSGGDSQGLNVIEQTNQNGHATGTNNVGLPPNSLAQMTNHSNDATTTNTYTQPGTYSRAPRPSDTPLTADPPTPSVVFRSSTNERAQASDTFAQAIDHFNFSSAAHTTTTCVYPAITTSITGLHTNPVYYNSVPTSLSHRDSGIGPSRTVEFDFPRGSLPTFPSAFDTRIPNEADRLPPTGPPFRRSTGYLDDFVAPRGAYDSAAVRVKFSLKEYDGREPWQTYKQHLEVVARANGWSEDKLVVYVPPCLRSTALTFYYTLSPIVQGNFTLLDQAFEERFSGRQQQSIAHTQLQHRVQKDKETLAEFATDLERLTLLAFPECPESARSRIALGQFVGGLADSEVQLRVREADPKTLRAALALAIHLESSREATRVSRKSVRVARTTASVKPSNRKNSGNGTSSA